MPGRSNPSRFWIRTSTGKTVTFCSVCAWGSILRTVPSNGRLGYASTVIVASWPGCTLPMSVSSTSVRTWTRLRSAIWSRVVPPLTFAVAEAMTVPRSTVFAMIVPVIGARTSVSSSWMRALSTDTRERTTWALASA